MIGGGLLGNTIKAYTKERSYLSRPQAEMLKFNSINWINQAVQTFDPKNN